MLSVEQNINAIIKWDEKKLRFLGSHNITKAVDHGLDFNDIEKLYDEDPDKIENFFTELFRL